MEGYSLTKKYIKAAEFAEQAGISMETLNDLLKSSLEHMCFYINKSVFVDTAALVYFQNEPFDTDAVLDFNFD